MSSSSLSTLKGFIEASARNLTEKEFSKWQAKVAAFILVAFGPELKSSFLNVDFVSWEEDMEANIGFIHGLISKFEDEAEPVTYI